ncbi:MAG TPA: methyltransferase domain-containing protein [Bryobacteraceae bacterium]|jgi:predicted methyltransferase|nr:methyltransferase domain-containing protein [Bryobacteraceae bacterium]
MRIHRAILLAACCPCCPMLWAQVATDANQRYQTEEGRQAIAANLGSAARDATERPQELVDRMDLKPGMTVADVGTGVGYMLPYLSRAVGPSGHVLAEDIFDDFLNAAKQRAADRKLVNVAFVKGTETDPRLPAGAVDLILALDSYHHYDYPEKMLAAFARALRDGGRLVVVEYYKRPNAIPGQDAVKHIRLDEPDLVREIEHNGFRKVSEREHIKGSQYMVVFTK